MDQHIIEGNRPGARATPIGKTAVVVGAGIAGLTVACGRAGDRARTDNFEAIPPEIAEIIC
jgi:hypothetical protein